MTEVAETFRTDEPVRKNIVLFSDGTGNSAGKLQKTNVWRTYQALDLSDPSRQVAYYDDGVGTSSFRPLAIIGGAFGWGLKRNVLDLYTFLCRNYVPGARIYGFGFSRGAFTIRVLAALVLTQGLVRTDSETELQRFAREAFRAYRQERYRSLFRLEVPARMIRDAFLGVRDWILRQESYEKHQERLPNQKVRIHFLGVWDTVAAYGLPIDELTRAWGAFFPLSPPDRNLHPDVDRACHAVALDDERNTFHPVLWNEEKEPLVDNIDRERITQVWFSGMHSSVGGGYPDDSLSHVSLDWMLDRDKDLILKPGERAKFAQAADAAGPLYDSRKGIGGSYRYMPRKLAQLTDQSKPRVLIGRSKIHESVFSRIAQGVDNYAPIVLPAKYAVVTRMGAIASMPEAMAPQVPVSLLEHPDQALGRSHAQEKVWNTVWWKRVAYFASILGVLALLAFPLFWPRTDACEGPLCVLSPVINLVGSFMPGFLEPWLKAYHSHPATFLTLFIAFVLLVLLGSLLGNRIRDRMRLLWLPTVREPRTGKQITDLPSDFIFRLRTHPAYQAFFRSLKYYVAPTVVGALAVFAAFAGFNKGGFAMLTSAGLFCQDVPDEKLRTVYPASGTFDSMDPCWASGIAMRKGTRYQITLTPANLAEWKDKDIPASVGGFGWEKMTPIMYLGLPMRRMIGEPWFKPVARIGDQGTDEYVLSPIDWSIPSQDAPRLVAEITARRDGQLFLYVNDTVFIGPRSWQGAYANNEGKATVEVVPVQHRDQASPGMQARR